MIYFCKNQYPPPNRVKTVPLFVIRNLQFFLKTPTTLISKQLLIWLSLPSILYCAQENIMHHHRILSPLIFAVFNFSRTHSSQYHHRYRFPTSLHNLYLPSVWFPEKQCSSQSHWTWPEWLPHFIPIQSHCSLCHSPERTPTFFTHPALSLLLCKSLAPSYSNTCFSHA